MLILRKCEKVKTKISLLLVISLLMTMIPLFSAEAEITEGGAETIVIDFGESISEQIGGKYVITSHPGYDIVEEESNQNNDHRNFSYGGGKYALHIYMPKLYWPENTTMENRFTILVDVTVAGYYEMSIQGGKFFAGCFASIYANDTYMGDYNFYDPATTRFIGETRKLNSVYLTEGYNKISFRSRSGHDSFVTPGVLLHKVWFEPLQTENILESIEAELPEHMVINDEFELNAQGIMTNGEAFHFGLTSTGESDFENMITVTSSDSDIISINDEINVIPGGGDYLTARLKANRIGSCEVTVTSVIGGTQMSRAQTIEVTAPPSMERVELVLSKEEIAKDKTGQASVLAWLTNGEQADLSAAQISYASSDTNIADIDLITGSITALAQGETVITVSVTIDDVTYTDSKTLTITPTATLVSVKLLLDQSMVLPNLNAQASVMGIMSDGEQEEIVGYEVVFESSDLSVAEIDEESGVITARSEGESIITVKVTTPEGFKDDSKILMVVPRTSAEILVDFSKTTTQESDIKYKYEIVSHPGYMIVEDESNQTGSRRSFNMGSDSYALAVYLSKPYWPEDTRIDNRFTILVDVPIAGHYEMRLQGAKWYAGCYASVYVGETYMGDYAFYDSARDRFIGEIRRLNSVYLTAGQHKISFRSRSGETSFATPALLLHRIWFIPMERQNQFESIDVDIPENMQKFDVMDITARAVMTDGTYHHFGFAADGGEDTENYFTVLSTDSSLVSVSNIKGIKPGGGDALNSKLYVAGQGGVCDIVYTAKVNGDVKTKVKTIEIPASDEKLDRVEADIGADEVFIGDTATIRLIPVLDSGRTISEDVVEISYENETPETTTLTENTITAHSAGPSRIKITAALEGVQTVSYFETEILPESMKDLDITAGGSRHIRLAPGTVPLIVRVFTNEGREIPQEETEFSYQSLTLDIADIDESGNITAYSEGDFEVEVTAKHGDRILVVKETMPVRAGKTAPTIMTIEERLTAQENAKKYDWVKREIDSYINQAGFYAERTEQLWNMVVSEGIPRSMTNGLENDPELYHCRYCGANLLAKYGSYPYIIQPFTNPWKIQCPDCRRRFPSNNFEQYYKLGLDERGAFDAELAVINNEAIISEGGQGYLTNQLYPEKGEDWGVDDGFGYLPGNVYSNGITERHMYIAYYLHWGLWNKNGQNGGIMIDAVRSLGYAYAYTGEMKYGRAGAILLDRIADFYPEYDLYPYRNITWNSHGRSYRGKTIGCIWECGAARTYALAYDLLYPAYDDSNVISFLKEKEEQYKMSHTKRTAAQIRNNVEDGILRTIFSGVIDGSISGNFGYPQYSIATAAVALDSMPETGEWLDWMMSYGVRSSSPNSGGNVAPQLVDEVDRDGMGNEASSYNVGWLTSMITIADLLDGYKTYIQANLYDNPKFSKMFTAFIPLILCSYYSPQIGDSHSTASKGLWMTTDIALKAFRQYGDARFAQIAYLLNGNKVDGLKESLTTKNPEQIQKDILNVINNQGTLDLTSEMMTGFGFSVLRDGVSFESVGSGTTYDSQRDFWIYFGKNFTGHAHRDNLNLGISAFGLNMAPDLGYPETTGVQPNRMQWVRTTLSHNTVTVNEREQDRVENTGIPMHFDDSGRVKVMDIDTQEAYAETDIYRRTLVMVEVSDEVSYGVDFFRVKGGDDHIFSFHSQSDEIFETEGLILETQNKGTYAGPLVEWGPNADVPSGYSWLNQIKRDTNPESKIVVDFKVKDFNRVFEQQPKLNLRVTMPDAEPLTEVTIANGYAPNKEVNKNVPNLKYLLARRTGEALDTLFTTVFEPYRDEMRYIKSIECPDIDVYSGTEYTYDTARAVKVLHENGRVDYVVYATNNSVTYRVDDTFNFRGFVGVYTIDKDEEDEVIYRYINDGDIIGELPTDIPCITGQVVDFTKELSRKNEIVISTNQLIYEERLKGRYIYIENDAEQNGVYRIENATMEVNGNITIDIGDVTPIRKYIDVHNLEAGFVYNIAEGQSFRIPLSYQDNNDPLFYAPDLREYTVDAGSEIRLSVAASSSVGKELVYTAVRLPRGATFNEETQVLRWVPDSRQQGQNHIAIEASDGLLSSVCHIIIKVLGSTVSSGPTTEKIIEAPSSDYGGDSGEVSMPEVIEPVTQTQRFKDLGDYEWAKDAILQLAEEGIIKGTSEDMYSPGSHIKRADFTVLIARAFDLKPNGTDNFKDVPADAYYTDAIQAAKDNGIIMGVGDNRYKPTERISRQDIMVIGARALKKQGYVLEEASHDTLSIFSDSAEVLDYAKSAAAVLVQNKIIEGSNGKLNPNAFITRAETAVVIKRIIDRVQQEGSKK